MVGGGPFYLKFWIKLTALERNRRFVLLAKTITRPAALPAIAEHLVLQGIGVDKWYGANKIFSKEKLVNCFR